MQHIPVLRGEVLSILTPLPGETIVDCTLGLGGHAEAFLDAIGPDGALTGIDADAGNLSSAKERLGRFGTRVHFQSGNFREVTALAGGPVDIVFADLGVSSPHFDDPERGFTFRASGPLDLRYDRSTGVSAAELLVASSEEQITEILSAFGELPRSRSLARTLHMHFRTADRALSSWKTDDVVACVEKVFTYKSPRVLPQVFQALRIAVNDEMGALNALLLALPTLLTPGGRCGIISYHSLEDRMVKQTFRTWCIPEIDQTTGQVSKAAPWELLTKKPVSPSEEELQKNPRSRSARFRAIQKIPG